MGKKGRPSIGQKQANHLLQQTRPDPQRLYEGVRKDYEQAARNLAAHPDSVGDALALSILGPRTAGDLAFALDPTSGFIAGEELIAESSRYRDLPNNFGRLGNRILIKTSNVEYRNFTDEHIIVDEYVYDSFDDEDEVEPNQYYIVPDSYCYDSTNATRGASKPYGLLDMRRVTWKDDSPKSIRKIETETDYTSWGGNVAYYKFVTVTEIIFLDGPIGLPEYNPIVLYDGDFDLISVEQAANLYDLISKVTVDRRVWNPWYQLAELRDLPKLVHQISDIKNVLLRLSTSVSEGSLATRVKRAAKNSLSTLDKDLANQYLGYKFGFESTYQAAMQALTLPTKTAKKLNYLLKRIGKPKTGRASSGYKEIPRVDEPALTLNLPDWVDASDIALIPQSMGIEHKLVACQQLQFPLSVVPEVNSVKLLNLLGLTPTIKDVYDIIPWTWLVDWYSDLGDYIGALSALSSSNALISYGFMTTILDQSYIWTGSLKVTNQDTVRLSDGTETVTESVTSYPFSLTLQAHLHVRRRVTDLPGVDSIDGVSTTWSDYQWSIIQSLLTKYGPK